MSKWDSNELERRTAARLGASGFIPILNVQHHATKSEFDVYAFHPRPDGVDRIMVQCTTSKPDHDKVAALKTHAIEFHCQDWMFVTSAKPHPDQVALAEHHEIPLLSEHPSSELRSATVNGVLLDVQAPRTVREMAIRAYFRGMSCLRRRALDLRATSCEAEEVVTVWNKLDEVPLIPDHFDRLRHLYGVHKEHFELSARCAMREFPNLDKPAALKKAYARDGGTYTQSALAVETSNRFLTLMTICECACVIAGTGEEVPADLLGQGRIGKFVKSLSKESFRHLLASFVFALLHSWGGMWMVKDEAAFKPMFCAEIGVTDEQFEWLRVFCNRLFKNMGHDGYIVHVQPWGNWYNILLLPFFVKGLHIRRMQHEMDLQLKKKHWRDWRTAAGEVIRECREWEQCH